MITADNLTAAKSTIDKLMAQGQSLYDDIAETAHDRARLLSEAVDREATIERLNAEITDLTARVDDLERRNGRLAEDTIKLESQLTDANARLETIHETSNSRPTPPRGNRPKDGEGVGHLSNRLHKLANAEREAERPTSVLVTDGPVRRIPPRAHND